jgi:hypothetical protein
MEIECMTNVQYLAVFYATQSLTTTVTHSCKYFVLQQIFLPFFIFLSFFPSSYALLHSTSGRDCTPWQCSSKGSIQSNQQMALSRLMHSIHCGSAIFPYQALETRLAQETLTGCAGLHNKKFEGTEHSPRMWKTQTFVDRYSTNNIELLYESEKSVGNSHVLTVIIMY